MAVDERARHELFVKLEGLLGPEEATTLMEHLPPVGWADVATKSDLLALDQRMELRFHALESDIRASRFEVLSVIEQKLREQTRAMIFALLGTTLTLGAIAIST